MIARIVRYAGFATKAICLTLSLDLLGASEQPSSRDVVVDESLVIRAAVECCGDERCAALGVERLEQPLNGSRSRGSGHIEGRPVAVIDRVHVVRRANHVEVEVEPDLVELGAAEAVDVEGAAEEAELLCGPEAEADSVPHAVFGEVLCDMQDADCACAVVVDTWSFVDAICVSA